MLLNMANSNDVDMISYYTSSTSNSRDAGIVNGIDTITHRNNNVDIKVTAHDAETSIHC